MPDRKERMDAALREIFSTPEELLPVRAFLEREHATSEALGQVMIEEAIRAAGFACEVHDRTPSKPSMIPGHPPTVFTVVVHRGKGAFAIGEEDSYQHALLTAALSWRRKLREEQAT